jgi:aldehyde dehydrogenase (NAD+)
VALPSERAPTVAVEFCTVLDSSDMPAGVVNVITGDREALALVLAGHLDVDGLWYCGSDAGAAVVERESAANLKRMWTITDRRDWFEKVEGEGRDYLRAATQVKNVWIPYGE